LDELEQKEVKFIDKQPRIGHANSRIAFIRNQQGTTGMEGARHWRSDWEPTIFTYLGLSRPQLTWRAGLLTRIVISMCPNNYLRESRAR
jgi:hypothetical protein